MQCQICFKMFSSREHRDRHKRTVHADVPILHYCLKCGKCYKRKDTLRRHVASGACKPAAETVGPTPEDTSLEQLITEYVEQPEATSPPLPSFLDWDSWL